MRISIQEYAAYDAQAVLPLYQAVGWTNYASDPAMTENAFRHSLKAYAAFDAQTLVGIVRAVGDGASILYIQDLLVLPAYQRQGIGTRLLHTLLSAYPDVRQKVLLTDDTQETLRFYQAAGFQLDTDAGCRALVKITG